MKGYIAVKTDQHMIEPNGLLNGRDTNASAKRLMDAIRQETVPLSAVIDLGDLADTIRNPDRNTAVATEESYLHAKSLSEGLPGVQLRLPGNHDDPKLLKELLGTGWDEKSEQCGTWKLGPTTFVGLDLRTGPEPTGYLNEETAIALEQVLKSEDKCVVCTHFPIFPSDNGRIDQGLSITNLEKLLEIVRRYSDKITGVLHGHIHLWWSVTYNGIPSYCSTGSGMAFRLEPQSDEYEKIIPQPLGYLLVGVKDDGSLIVRPRYIVGDKVF